MSTTADFTGTNTEKIDKLIGAMIELRTTVRLCLAVIGVGIPLMTGLLTFVVVQSFGTAAKLDRIADRVDRLEHRSDQLEAKVDRLGERVDRLESKVDRLVERLDRPVKP